MTKKELADKVAESMGLTKKQAGEVVDKVFDTVLAAATAGEKVAIKGFGSFALKVRAAKTGRNPQTGKEIKVPAKKTVTFKFSKDAEARLN